MRNLLPTRTRVDRNAHYFRALGLKRGECRIDIIREAAHQRAREVSGRSHPATVDLHRAEVAIAAYRLLDPRGRSQLYERIQLSCAIDQVDNAPTPVESVSSLNRNLNLQTSSPRTAPKAHGEIADNAHASSAIARKPSNCSVKLMEGEIVELAFECSCSESDEASDSEEEACSKSNNDSQFGMDERRRFVELLKKSETTEVEEPSSPLSPIGWIRARLGI